MTLEQESDPLRRIPIKHAADLRAEIGLVLRAARLKRGESLEVVASQTRISKRFLEALENDRFEEFPAVVYLRGFLKGYCEHLDLDFDEIRAKLELAKAEAAPAPKGNATEPYGKEVPPPRAVGKRPAEPCGETALPADLGNGIPSPMARSEMPHASEHGPGASKASDPTGAAGAIVLALALALGLGFWLFKEQSRDPAAKTQAAAPAALEPLPRPVEPKLVIHFKSDAWLRVSVDGQVVFEGRAPRGAAQEWKPVKFLALRTTAPAAIELDLNGTPFPLGAPTPDGEYRVDIP